IQVGDVLDESALDELVDDCRAKAFDVHRVPPGEVLDPPPELVGAARVLATPDDLPLGADQRAAARRALGRHLPGFRAPGAIGIDDSNDLRDDVAALLDDHAVAN